MAMASIIEKNLDFDLDDDDEDLLFDKFNVTYTDWEDDDDDGVCTVRPMSRAMYWVVHPHRGGGGTPRTPRTPTPPPLLENPRMDSERACGCTWSTARATAPSLGQPTPGVVKQDQSSGGSVDTTKTCSDPQRVRMSSGERPIGAANGKQPDTEALCHPPPPPPQRGLWPTISCQRCRPQDHGHRRRPTHHGHPKTILKPNHDPKAHSNLRPRPSPTPTPSPKSRLNIGTELVGGGGNQLWLVRDIKNDSHIDGS